MSDILDRLREDDPDGPWTGPDGLFQEAAAEIDRLRARILELEAACAVTFGTLEAINKQNTALTVTSQEHVVLDSTADRIAFSIEHNVPGNAPT